MDETRGVKGIPKVTHSVPAKRSASQIVLLTNPGFLRILMGILLPRLGLYGYRLGDREIARDLSNHNSLMLFMLLM